MEVFELSEKFLKVQVAVKRYYVAVGVAVVIVDMQAGKLASKLRQAICMLLETILMTCVIAKFHVIMVSKLVK